MRRLFRPGGKIGWSFQDLRNATRCRHVGPRGGIFVVCRRCAGKLMSANPLLVAARQSVYLLGWQAGWVVIVALIGALLNGRIASVSLLVGGSIGLMWTVYMTLTFFRHGLTHGRHMTAATLFGAWAIKLVLTIVLLVIAFRSPHLAPLWVLGGLVGALVAYWLWFVLGLQQRWVAAR
jgi:F0F1-type ATP synthase assembly protein I